MNKKDFWTLIICCIGSFVLLVEHLCGLQLALPILCVWSIFSLIILIVTILRNYKPITITTEEVS